ncbi:unnamed protein product, partial [Rotaria sp. Silwood2]
AEQDQKDILVPTYVTDRVIDIKDVSLIFTYDMANTTQGKQQKKIQLYFMN